MDKQTADGTALRNIGAEEFAQLLQDNPNAKLIDVRTYFEYTAGHLPDAQLFDIMDPEWPERIQTLDRDNPVFLYCRSGNRSYQAGMYMAQLGFRELYNLADGIISWTGDINRE